MSTELFDALCGPDGDESLALVCNKRARDFINSGFEKPRPRWGNAFSKSKDVRVKAQKYRVLILDKGPGVAAMLWDLHEAGFKVGCHCSSCDEFHQVDDHGATRLLLIARGADVLPDHDTVQ